MKWWDWMPWSSFSECCALSQHFHSPLSISSRKKLIRYLAFGSHFWRKKKLLALHTPCPHLYPFIDIIRLFTLLYSLASSQEQLLFYLFLFSLMVESSNQTWSTGEGNGTPFQYYCLENPMNSMKRQKDKTLKDELPRVGGAQYATRDQWRNNSRKNEGMEPKQKQHPLVDVTGDGSKVWCCKEQYCIGTWNVRSMNQGKLEVVKQGMVNHFTILALRTPWTVWKGKIIGYWKRNSPGQ